MEKNLKDQVKDDKIILEQAIEVLIAGFEGKTGFTVTKILRKSPATEGQSRISVVASM